MYLVEIPESFGIYETNYGFMHLTQCNHIVEFPKDLVKNRGKENNDYRL